MQEQNQINQKNQKNKMVTYTNIHTHIFNLKCVPRRFYEFPVAKLLGKILALIGISRFLKLMVPVSKKDMFDRYTNVLLIGSKKNQDMIFEELLESYNHLKMRFVVHSLDMDMMEAGETYSNYETQITQLFEVKKKFPDQLLPFLSVDPRKDYNGSLYNYVKDKFDRHGFIGIKLYPALGFYPFNPKLTGLYDFAVENNIPITVHCDKDGIFYQGQLQREHLLPDNLNLNSIYNHDYRYMAEEKIKDFKNNFSNPRNFDEVLSVYPKLKLCFAHFGGTNEIKNSGTTSSDSNFHLKIKELLENPSYPNLYTDTSYILSENKKIIDLIVNDIKNPVYRNRILFGSDFYMTAWKKKETKLFSDFLKWIAPHDFQQIAVNNCNTFLSSYYYTP